MWDDLGMEHILPQWIAALMPFLSCAPLCSIAVVVANQLLDPANFLPINGLRCSAVFQAQTGAHNTVYAYNDTIPAR